MSAHARHLARTLAIALSVAAIALLAAVMDASAYVTASGSASARASITTLAAPTITRTSTGAGSVTLSWSTVTAPSSGTVTYYVRRDGGAASAACPSAASPSAVTSCTDTGVSAGAHSYTVTAVWRSWTRASAAASVSVAFGVATQLVFTTQPGGSSTGGIAFPTQPTVTARDASGNTVLTYSGSVELSILRGGAAGAALSGCVGTLRNGVTSFAGCEIDKSGTGYVLRASDRSLTVDSSSFNVSVGPTAQLLFTTQPGGGATGGVDFPSQPVVTAADAGGNTVTSFSNTVTLALLGGTPGASLDTCSSTSARNGVASFSGCDIDEAGTGYQLRATATGGLRGDSAAFNVSVGPINRLNFTTEPAGATGGTAFPTQPVVAAEDAGGNTVTTYNGTVTLAIVRFSGTSGAVLSSCTSSLRSGLTTFAGCKIDKVGSDYQLRASDGSRSIDTDEFAVVAGAAVRLDFTTNPSSSVTAGAAFSTQPVLTAYDAGGNTATGYAGTVTLTVGSGPAGGALTGCIGSRRSGVTTFSGCKLDKVGSYVLHASDGTLADDSTSITVNVGSVASLLFTTQPGGAVDDTAFTTQPAVTAVDSGGNTVTSYNSTITLSIVSGTGTSGASISGCSLTRTNGVTQFRSCLINRSGTGYVLRASDGTRTVNSTPFDVR